MPVYEYTCSACGGKFEKLVRSMMSDEAKASPECPSCGSAKTARALSVFAAVGTDGKSSGGGDVPMCGRCGGAPGSCQM